MAYQRVNDFGEIWVGQLFAKGTAGARGHVGGADAPSLAANDQLRPFNYLMGASSAFVCSLSDQYGSAVWPSSVTQSVPLWNGGPGVQMRSTHQADGKFCHEGAWPLFPDPPFDTHKDASETTHSLCLLPCFPIVTLLGVPTTNGASYVNLFNWDSAGKPGLFYTFHQNLAYTSVGAATVGRYAENFDSYHDARPGFEINWWDPDRAITGFTIATGATTVVTKAGHGWGTGTTAPNADFSVCIKNVTNVNPLIRCNGRFGARRIDANTFELLNDDNTSINSTGDVWTVTAAGKMFRGYEGDGVSKQFSFGVMLVGPRRYGTKYGTPATTGYGVPSTFRALTARQLAESLFGVGGESRSI